MATEQTSETIFTYVKIILHFFAESKISLFFEPNGNNLLFSNFRNYIFVVTDVVVALDFIRYVFAWLTFVVRIWLTIQWLARFFLQIFAKAFQFLI